MTRLYKQNKSYNIAKQLFKTIIKIYNNMSRIYKQINLVILQHNFSKQ